MKTLLATVAVFAVLAAGVAHAGALAPAPRVAATLERDAIERSGAQTLQEYLDTGVARYFLTGGQSLLVLVNGRPYATTSSNLDTLPLSAVERVELLASDTLGTLDASAVRGAINVVLRSDLEGFETRGVSRMPGQDGGDGWQGSVFWGGAVGKGRMTLGVDALTRQEITARSRDYSRSEWRPGGAFNEAKNVSVGGNTVWINQRDDDGTPTDLRSIALGDCDTAKGYTGPLSNPPGITSGDEGCGFAYGDIMWNSESYEQQSAILNLEHPLGEQAQFRMDANLSRGEAAFRYAPSVDSFAFRPNARLLGEINAAAPDFEADDNDSFAVGHRFVGHGNRDWLTDIEEYDVSASIEGRITEDLGYDARISFFRGDGLVDGNTFVHQGTLLDEVLAGNYDLVNPFSDDPRHQQAIKNSSVRLENDFGSEHLGARLALEGSRLSIGGRPVAWTTGFELERVKAHAIRVYHGNDGKKYSVSEVLGSGGTSYKGERDAAAVFADMALPLVENLDLRIAGRRDEYDDVGGLWSWRLGARYRLTDIVTLGGSWSAGDTSPSMFYLYSLEPVQDHPYIQCDPGTGAPPRSCPEINPRQVTRATKGNPDLDPADTQRLTIGAEARKGPFLFGVDWYRLSRSGLPGQNSADWAMRNLDECMAGDTTDCIERIAGDLTIHNGYANVVDSEMSGVNARLGMGFETDWAVLGLRGTWRHVADTDLQIAGEKDRLATPKNIARLGLLARRGGVSFIWTTYYRSSYRNRQDTGTFESWTGHDAVLEWASPLGLDGARITAGVFNLTDAGLAVDTANPNSVDGPTEADWGRTFFLTFNLKF